MRQMGRYGRRARRKTAGLALVALLAQILFPVALADVMAEASDDTRLALQSICRAFDTSIEIDRGLPDGTVPGAATLDCPLCCLSQGPSGLVPIDWVAINLERCRPISVRSPSFGKPTGGAFAGVSGKGSRAPPN